MRRLIINADDFGLTLGVNRAIVEAHRKGAVTSATLMASGAAFDQAVETVSAAPKLSVGCHVVLMDGSSQLAASLVPTLAHSDKNGTARFRSGWGGFAAAALTGKLSFGEITAEAAAQIRKLQTAGIQVSHVDTHKHAHMFPQVLQPLLRAAIESGVKAIRNPFEATNLHFFRQHSDLAKRWLATSLLNRFSKGFRRTVKEAGMVTPDGSIGVIATGSLSQPLLHEMIENLPEGTWELVCHPGFNDAQLKGVKTRLRESRTKELELLISPEFPALLSRCGIELISYRDLAEK